MGQSVHAIGFRLRKWKHWVSKECIIEKERYIERVRRERLVRNYVSYFFDRVLSLQTGELFRRGREEAEEHKKNYKKLSVQAYLRLKRKWKAGTLGDEYKDVSSKKRIKCRRKSKRTFSKS